MGASYALSETLFSIGPRMRAALSNLLWFGTAMLLVGACWGLLRHTTYYHRDNTRRPAAWQVHMCVMVCDGVYESGIPFLPRTVNYAGSAHPRADQAACRILGCDRRAEHAGWRRGNLRHKTYWASGQRMTRDEGNLPRWWRSCGRTALRAFEPDLR